MGYLDDARVATDQTGDFVLVLLSRLAHTVGLQMDLTLWVGGAVVSGALSCRSEWLRGLARAAVDGGGRGEDRDGGQAATFGEAMGRLAEEWAAVDLAASAEEEAFEEPRPVRYIHLRDARVVAPGGTAPGEGVWWRGRIDQVDGFAVGRIDNGD